MRFKFRFGADGRFNVTGLAIDAPSREVYHREGRYVVQGNRFVSQAISDGQPVQLHQDGGELFFILDETLWFRLRRPLPD